MTIAKRFCACASVTIADASLPSTLSALKPVATPVAFVVSGAAFGFAASIVPTAVAFLPLEASSNARPSARLFARTQGSLPFAVPPTPERQP